MGRIAERGYVVRDLEDRLSALELERELLKADIAERRGLATVHERMQMLGFVDAEQVVYLSGSDALAVRSVLP